MPVHVKSKLIKKEMLKEDIYKYVIEAPEIASKALPRTISRNKSNRQSRPTT